MLLCAHSLRLVFQTVSLMAKNFVVFEVRIRSRTNGRSLMLILYALFFRLSHYWRKTSLYSKFAFGHVLVYASLCSFSTPCFSDCLTNGEKLRCIRSSHSVTYY